MRPVKERIAELLEQTIGLRTSSIGSLTLDRAVKFRMRELGIEEAGGYYDKVAGSGSELRKLVEEVVVPETWFFRDQAPFQFLLQHLDKLRRMAGRERFRILSLPCSSGEEPYSIAITLLEAEFETGSFSIDAVDVSERVLARARRGIYREHSFRSLDLTFRDTYFRRTEEGYSLNKEVRNRVRFFQGNILQENFIRTLGHYDVVFCRNILIYFNEEAQRQAVETLYHLLVPGGVLFTGYAEAIFFYQNGFSPVPYPQAFAFYRRERGKTDALIETAMRIGRKRDMRVGRTERVPAVARHPRPVVTADGAVQDDEEKTFTLVRQLADEGRLEEAAGQCEEFLRRHAPSARWYYLLGVIRDSQGYGGEALKLLRKAAYLDPENVDSLVQLALLAERSGDHAGAENYRRRARKLQEGRQRQ